MPSCLLHLPPSLPADPQVAFLAAMVGPKVAAAAAQAALEVLAREDAAANGADVAANGANVSGARETGRTRMGVGLWQGGLGPPPTPYLRQKSNALHIAPQRIIPDAGALPHTVHAYAHMQVCTHTHDCRASPTQRCVLRLPPLCLLRPSKRA